MKTYQTGNVSFWANLERVYLERVDQEKINLIQSSKWMGVKIPDLPLLLSTMKWNYFWRNIPIFLHIHIFQAKFEESPAGKNKFNYFFHPPCLIHPKGQINLKADLRAVDSPKKRTNKSSGKHARAWVSMVFTWNE